MKERSIKSLVLAASALAATFSPVPVDIPNYNNTTVIPAIGTANWVRRQGFFA